MRNHRFLSILLALPACAMAQGVRPSDPLDPLKACIEGRAARDEFSGAMLVAERGRIIWQAGFGYSDAERQAPNTTETRFSIASTGKMFTAVAIGQLVEAGRLHFDDPIGRHLPGLTPEVGAITIHQLLTHTSGLGNYFQPQNRPVIRAARTAADLLPIALAEAPAFTPGSRQAYSNSGFVVLGAIIERLSGLGYADYLQRFIFAPAGMTATSLDGVAPRALPMTRMDPGGGGAAASGPRRPAPMMGSPRGTPAGGMTSTVGDMFRFAEALRGHRLIRRETTERLWQAHIATYGYGFTRVDVGGTRLVGHGGGAPGANAQFEIYPEWARVVIALSNYDPPVATEAVDAARRAFLGAEPAAICVRPAPGAAAS